MISTEYKQLTLKSYPQSLDRVTSENRYWQNFRSPVTSKEIAQITSIDFCPSSPYDLAVTTSTRVHIYSTETNQLKKTLSRFKDIVYSGTFRNDGKLLVAGGESKEVQVFDLGTRAVLRKYTGHQEAVHVTKFSNDNVHILSCSDDKTVRYWDLPSQKPLAVLSDHKDYIRSASQNPSSTDLWTTGSYDHTVKMWDFRSTSKVGTSAVMTVDHGEPVESCLVLPGGSLLMSAGGNSVKVWDILGGGRLLHTFSNHQKTITNLCVDGTGTRLLSSSLDGHVKVYDIKTYQVTHGFKYDFPVLSFGISSTNSHIAVGTTDQHLHIQQRIVKSAEVREEAAKQEFRGGSYGYFIRGKTAKPTSGDYLVEVSRSKRLKPYDFALRKFRYKEALDAALDTRQPLIVASMLQELLHRGSLITALSGRDEVTLEPLLSFLIKCIPNPRFSKLLVEVCGQVFDLYFPILGQSMVIDGLFVKLQKCIDDEILLQKQMLGIVGMIDTVMASQTQNSSFLGANR